jgi:hypothetical protein
MLQECYLYVALCVVLPCQHIQYSILLVGLRHLSREMFLNAVRCFAIFAMRMSLYALCERVRVAYVQAL